MKTEIANVFVGSRMMKTLAEDRALCTSFVRVGGQQAYMPHYC
jgi:hypothetical protein